MPIEERLLLGRCGPLGSLWVVSEDLRSLDLLRCRPVDPRLLLLLFAFLPNDPRLVVEALEPASPFAGFSLTVVPSRLVSSATPYPRLDLVH